METTTNESGLKNAIKLLSEPFDPKFYRERKNPYNPKGKPIRYVETAHYIRRLNEADPAWKYVIAEVQFQDEFVLVQVELTICGVTRPAYGGARIKKKDGGPILNLADDVKAAVSDALKKAATLFGLGLDLHVGGQPDEPFARDSDDRDRGAGKRKEGAPDGGSKAPAKSDLIVKKILRAKDDQGLDWPAFNEVCNKALGTSGSVPKVSEMPLEKQKLILAALTGVGHVESLLAEAGKLNWTRDKVEELVASVHGKAKTLDQLTPDEARRVYARIREISSKK